MSPMGSGAPLLVGLALLACGGCDRTDGGDSREAPASGMRADLEALRGARILIGHQSVGEDILDGLEALKARHGVALRLERLPGEGLPVGPAAGIGAFRVGRNEDPASKCGHFLRALESAGDAYDAVLMKFCYVDIGAGSDVDAVFAAYRDFAAKAKALAPSAVFVHATVPLRREPRGIKALVKRLLGRDTESAANAGRNAFNERLLAEYPGEPVFDIARAESTLPDGSRTSSTRDGKRVYSLADGYTYDGGHLNAAGKERLAAELARVLASALRSRFSLNWPT